MIIRTKRALMNQTSFAHQLSQYARLRPYRQGLQLEKPDVKDHSCIMLGEMFAWPMAAYIMDTNSCGVAGNLGCAALNSLYSENDLIGKTSVHFYEKKTALKHQFDDEIVMRNKALFISSETADRINADTVDIFTLKLPLYVQKSVAGVLGLTISTSKHNWSEFATHMGIIVNAGLIQTHFLPTTPKPQVDDVAIFFTRREQEILSELVRGKSAKIIANVLGLSVRTVENNILRMRDKTNCASKFELIDKYIDKVLYKAG